jgi:hypothetical protein
MGWQDQLDKAMAAMKEAADSETARDIADKALQSISRTLAPRTGPRLSSRRARFASSKR